jgi:hypothetical protein
VGNSKLGVRNIDARFISPQPKIFATIPMRKDTVRTYPAVNNSSVVTEPERAGYTDHVPPKQRSIGGPQEQSLVAASVNPGVDWHAGIQHQDAYFFSVLDHPCDFDKHIPCLLRCQNAVNAPDAEANQIEEIFVNLGSRFAEQSDEIAFPV